MTEKEILGILMKTRKERKLTLMSVSEDLGIHRNSLSRIESGKIENVKYEFVERYAKVLDYDLTLIHKVKQ